MPLILKTILLVATTAILSTSTMSILRSLTRIGRRYHSMSNHIRSLSSSVSNNMATDVDISHVEYENFSFDVTQKDTSTRARLGVLKTPHGVVHTPNFVFCATKAAMKAMTPEHLREAGSQIILSNTYHLMLTPGSELVEKMGGLQKFTDWRGPMLTDSGGYQIFSMGFGSVSSEIKGKRDTIAMGWNQTLIKIDEEGATFRSYVDGTIHHLTPEKSINIQRQLGADLIVVLDECTPFNVDKQYTADSMRRSHRWALRSLQEFARGNTGKQALYGIIQGGVYEDLRDESVAFVNEHPFFGIAIGGSLGATKKGMHEIVAYTRARVRDDRPVHLLGIGGVRDIFHGVRQGIDTFDCVHPSRLGRHGGALVLAAHWSEEPHPEAPTTPMTLAVKMRADKLAFKNAQRAKQLLAQQAAAAAASAAASENTFESQQSMQQQQASSAQSATTTATTTTAESSPSLSPQQIGELGEKIFQKRRKDRKASKQNRNLRLVREHINVSKGPMRNDPRPIDSTCGCYTCKNFSRAYLHHLFKARESLGGTLVTIHNVFFMNRLMADIREGIATGTLDDVERKYVHPDLIASLESTDGEAGSDGIGS